MSEDVAWGGGMIIRTEEKSVDRSGLHDDDGVRDDSGLGNDDSLRD
jgi:hypothetical protein